MSVFFVFFEQDKALHAHFTAVADNSPVPVILYSVPAFTGKHLLARIASSFNHIFLITWMRVIIHNENVESF